MLTSGKIANLKKILNEDKSTEKYYLVFAQYDNGKTELLNSFTKLNASLKLILSEVEAVLEKYTEGKKEEIVISVFESDDAENLKSVKNIDLKKIKRTAKLVFEVAVNS
jgi:hypothetical protein